MKRLYAIRGACQALNTKDSIMKETVELCEKLIKANNLNSDDIVSWQFTTTPDLDEMNPCFAMRKGVTSIDTSRIPLFSSQESNIKGMLPRVVRTMITTYLEEGSVITPIYTNGAEALRPDLSK